jgi:ornithine racemase
MAELIIHTDKIKQNIIRLSNFFQEKGIYWSLITKVFSGDETFLSKILTEETIQGIHSIGDSRLTSLRNLRAVNPKLKTIYIKPPAQVYADDVVKYANISLNSSIGTIKALNVAAQKADTMHQIIIMIELGELREGVQQDALLNFYEQVFKLTNIDVIGLGSNLGCMYGVEPSYDKLLQLSLYKELIAARFGQKLELLSGGTSITLPMTAANQIPKEVNHFRIGEAAFFGKSPLHNARFAGLHIDTFEFKANIIELEIKGLVPEGTIGDASVGHTKSFSESEKGQTATKAILDFGLLDADKDDLETSDPGLQFVGTTSDMMVVDVGDNRDAHGKHKYQVGGQMPFHPNYMAVARLLNSKFIDKKFV